MSLADTITGFYVPKVHLGFEVHHSGGLWNNFDPLGIFNVHRKLDTQAFSFFAFISKCPVVELQQ